MNAKGSDDDSDDSGGSDFDDVSDAESSSVQTGSDEEGEDWDEMERKTIERENKERLANLEQGRQIAKTGGSSSKAVLQKAQANRLKNQINNSLQIRQRR